MKIRNIVIATFGIVAVLAILFASQGAEAAEDPEQDSFYVTDISPTGFSVVWTTAADVGGNITWGDTPALGNYTTLVSDTVHYHNVSSAGTGTGSWYFNITSDGADYFDGDSDMDWTTGEPTEASGSLWQLVVSPTPPPGSHIVYGHVTNDLGSDADDVVVILQNSTGDFLSNVTAADGNFTLNTYDSVGPFTILILGAEQGTGGQGEISVSGSPQDLGEFQLYAGPGADPVLGNFFVSDVTNTTFAVSWTTVSAVDGFIYYGDTMSLGNVTPTVAGSVHYHNVSAASTTGKWYFMLDSDNMSYLDNDYDMDWTTGQPEALFGSVWELTPPFAPALPPDNYVVFGHVLNILGSDAQGVTVIVENSTGVMFSNVTDSNGNFTMNTYDATGPISMVIMAAEQGYYENASITLTGSPQNLSDIQLHGGPAHIISMDFPGGTTVSASGPGNFGGDIEIFDVWGNTCTEYSGTIHFDTTCPGTRPGDAGVPGGTKSYVNGFSLTIPGTQWINVTDITAPWVISDNTQFTVTPGAIDSIDFAFDGSADAGVDEPITFTFYDSLGNENTTGTLNIDFTSNDPNAEVDGNGLPWTAVGVSSGDWFNVTLFDAGSMWLNATNSTISDNETWTVAPDVLDHVLITDSPDGTEIGAEARTTDENSVNYYASGYDQYNNYLGLINGTWTWSGAGLGTFNNSDGTDVVVHYTTPEGVGQSLDFIDETATHLDSTGFITVKVGAVVNVVISLVGPETYTAGGANATAYTATMYDADGNVNITEDLVWSVTDLVNAGPTTMNASINSTTGVLDAGIGAGTGNVNVSAGAVSNTSFFTVKPAAVDDVVISPAGPSTYTAGGASATDYDVVMYDIYDNVNNTVTPVWSVTDLVDAGPITMDASINSTTGVFDEGIGAGTGNVNVSAGAASNTSAFTVVPALVDDVVISPAGPSTYTAGGASATDYDAVMYDAYGNVNTTETLVWSAVITFQYGGVPMDFSINSSTGVFDEGIGTGTGDVQVTAGGASDTSSFTVNAAAVVDVVISPVGPTNYTAGGASATDYDAMMYDTYGNVNTSEDPVWSVTDLVDVGLITMNASINSTTGVFDEGVGAGTGNVNVTAGAVSNTSAFTVEVGPASSIVINPAGPKNYTAGGASAAPYTAIVYDAYGNVNTTETVSWSLINIVPAYMIPMNADINTTTGVFDEGTTAGTGDVEAVAGGASNTSAFTVKPDAIDSIMLVSTGFANVSVPEPMAIFFLDQYFNFNDTETLDINFTSNDPTAEVDNQTLWWTATGVSNGDAFPVEFYTAGTMWINATNGSMSYNITWTVFPGPLNHVVITDAPDGAEVGAPTYTTDNNSVAYFASGYDQYNNYLYLVPGTWSFFVGLGNLNSTSATDVVVDYIGTGNTQLNYNDGSHSDDTGAITVNPGAADSIVIDPNGGSKEPGTPFNVNVTVLDADGNVKTDFADTINFTCSDPTAEIGGSAVGSYLNLALPGGAGIFSVNISEAGPQWLNVSATSTPSVSESAAYSMAEVDEVLLSIISPVDVAVTHTIDIVATAWNSTYEVALPGIDIDFTFQNVGASGTASLTPSSPIVTDADGNATVTFDPGLVRGDVWTVTAEMTSFGVTNTTPEISVIWYQPDISILVLEDNSSQIGKDVYEDTPSVQIVDQSTMIDGTQFWLIFLDNAGDGPANFIFEWDDTSLPGAWDMDMRMWKGAPYDMKTDFDDPNAWIDITAIGSQTVLKTTMEESTIFMLNITTDSGANPGDWGVVDFSVRDDITNYYDNGTVNATIGTPDGVEITAFMDGRYFSIPSPVDPLPLDFDDMQFVAVLTEGDDPVEIVDVWWNYTNVGSSATCTPDDGSFTDTVLFNTGSSVGLFTLTIEYDDGTDAWSDTVEFNISFGWDSIEITDSPNGTVVVNQDVTAGQDMLLYGSVYNDTVGYVGFVPFIGWETWGGNAYTFDRDNDSTYVDFGNVMGQVLVNVSVDMPGNDDLIDSVTFTVLPPMPDTVMITYTPDGGYVGDHTTWVGQHEWLNVSAYNTSSESNPPVYTPDYDGDNVAWSIVNMDGATGELLNANGNATRLYSGYTGGWILVTVSYEGMEHTINVTVTPPEVDFIAISYTTDGSNMVAGGEIAYSTSLVGYACGYNNSVWSNHGISSELVNGVWDIGNSGALSTHTNATGTWDVFNATDVANPGVSWWNLTYGAFSPYNVGFSFTTVDWVEITYGNGTGVLNSTDVGGISRTVGTSEYLYCAAFNSGSGFIGFVPANWTIQNFGGSASVANPDMGTAVTMLEVGTLPGSVFITMNYSGMEDTLNLTIVEDVLDYIAIELLDGSSPASVYTTDDNTVDLYLRGYDRFDNLLGDYNGDWLLDGDNGSFTGANTGVDMVSIDWTTVGMVNLSVDYSGMTDTLMVTVDVGALANIVITPGIVTGLTADSPAVDFDAIGYDADLNPVATTFTWSTNDTEAILNPTTGLFEPVTAGIWNIAATSGTVSSKVDFTVGVGDFAYITVLPDGNTITTDNTTQFTAVGYDADDNEITGLSFVWSVDDPNATIVAGLYDAVTSGNWTINATSGTLYDTATVNVAPGAIFSVIVTPDGEIITADDTLQLTAVAYDADGNVVNTTFTWAVSDSAATISSSGLFDAVTVGAVSITARADDVPGSALVSVGTGAIFNITVTPGTTSLEAGDEVTFNAVAYDADGNIVSTVFTWSTNDPDGSVTSNGVYVAGSAGNWTVTATAGAMSGTADTGVIDTGEIPGSFGSIVEDWWWLFLVLIIALLAIIILLFKRKPKEEEDYMTNEAAAGAGAASTAAPGGEEAVMGECPTCGATISLEAMECSECGELFEEEPSITDQISDATE